MGSLPDSPSLESIASGVDLPTPRQHARHNPDRLDELCGDTKFSRREIRLMYRGFKQECPGGLAYEDKFREIFAKFFPCGDSSKYAGYVFKAFDVRCKGELSFKDLVTGLSLLLRGSAVDRLRWTFHLYDAGRDGRLSRDELRALVAAVHSMVAGPTSTMQETMIREHADNVFKKLAGPGKETLTVDQFVDACLKDAVIYSSLRQYTAGFDHIC